MDESMNIKIEKLLLLSGEEQSHLHMHPNSTKEIVNNIKSLLKYYEIAINDEIFFKTNKNEVQDYIVQTLANIITEALDDNEIYELDPSELLITNIFKQYLDDKDTGHIPKNKDLRDLFDELCRDDDFYSYNSKVVKLSHFENLKSSNRYKDPINLYIERYHSNNLDKLNNSQKYNTDDDNIANIFQKKLDIIQKDINDISHKYNNDQRISFMIYLYIRNSLINNYK